MRTARRATAGVGTAPGYCYRLGGLRVASTRPLLGLAVEIGGEPDVTLAWMEAPLIAAGEPLGELRGRDLLVTRDGKTRFRLLRDLEFELSARASVIRVWSPLEPGLPLTHLIADSVIPLALSAGGGLVLHGAGLVVRREALVLLGDSGTGKSTLASRWVAEGGTFLSDDWLRVVVRRGRAFGLPAHPSIRLRDDRDLPPIVPALPEPYSASGYNKRWHAWGSGRAGFYDRACAINRMIACRRDDDLAYPTLLPLGGQAALRLLLSKMFVLDMASGRAWQRRLDLISRVLSVVGVEELAFPSGPSGLAGVLQILRDAARR